MTRIDYICVPQALWEAQCVQGVRVLYNVGDRLQHPRTPYRADHRPVEMDVDFNLFYTGKKGGPKWDWA